MPRGRKPQSPGLSPGQAAYVIDRLVADRKVSSADVTRYVSEMGREISELERRLQMLRAAHGTNAPAAAAGARRGGRPGRPAAAAAASGAGGRRSRKRAPITAEQAASRQLQGKYLSLVRRFPQNKRAQFAKIARERGREAAIKEMQQQVK